jgi:penicillin-binding protein 2
MKDANRSLIYISIMFAVLGVYLLRLFYIQVVDTNYELLSNDNSRRRVVVFPPRGLIFDRKDRLIVGNSLVFDLKVIPEKMDPKMDTTEFCRLLNIEKQYFLQAIAKARSYSVKTSSDFLTQIKPEKFISFQERMYEFPGFFSERRTVRDYLYDAAPHALGYIGEVSQKAIDNSNGYYQKGDYLGITGIERYYEDTLRGQRGVKYLYVDVHNRQQGSYKAGRFDTIADNGKNLTLGLDIELQQYGEKLMQNKRGAIVAIEPATGQILCFVSSPGYSLKNFIDREERTRVMNALYLDSMKPMFNRAVMSSTNPPGSTFKLLQALIGFQIGVLTPSTVYSCYGGFPLGGGRKIGCHSHPSPLAFSFSITTSCNAYYCNVFRSIINHYPTSAEGLRMWRTYMYSFGLGHKLGIDLPSEKAGLLPTPELYDKFYGVGKWNAMTIISLAIGQSDLGLTPLQMANMCAVIANRGYYYAPHLVAQIDKKPLADTTYTNKHSIAIERQYFDWVADAMNNVINNGTGRSAKIEGIESCGKTGTAQNPQGADHSIFISFAPKDKPKIALAVYIENGGFGATYAAPIAGLLMEKYLCDTISTAKLPVEKRMMEAKVLSFGKAKKK